VSDAGRTVLRWSAAFATAAGIAALARRKRALTLDGAVAATAVGTVVQARGGLAASAALIAFFVSSSALSRVGEAKKARRGVLAQAKGGERDAWQVLANGGVAAGWLLIGPRDVGGFLGALATAAADTWATELGTLARTTPRRITTLRPVQPGASGGVTPEGTIASIAGAAVVAATWRLLAAPSRALVPTILAGTLGALTDSVLGATLQASYWCVRCAEATEVPVHPRCGEPAHLVRGRRWIDNDRVNLLATFAGSLVGALLLGQRRD
jgi:uncharacterized protein (TIGR00297 family)